MAGGIRWGVMATVDDIDRVRTLDVDFIELLVRDGDNVTTLDSTLSNSDREMIVHAPERIRLEGAARLLDLADRSLSRRQECVRRIAEVVEVATSHGAATVVHPGGVLTERTDDVSELRRNLADSLASIDGRMWLENMPRGYHSGDELLLPHLLLHPQDFDEVLPLIDGVTLDVCHAYLSVERGGNGAIAEFFERLKGSIRHIHLSDAAYPHREGLPLGEGDIEMTMLPRMRHLPVLLEVWNGHLGDLAGHRRALETVRRADWFRGCIP